ncbi:hypothetical protein HCN44_003436 [Aphidius gifuensis]|uniref:Uncharacterized protein n=1 Tax=Aphidius gifuensis TaxID=684658 RepID=A0A835CMY4_APHGI|nr:hypothetical protein HCN44_003436 [Aphidius gifuensis]
MANNVIPESDTDSDDDIPSEMRQKASKIFQNLLLGKSKEKYLSVYHEFQGWMDKNNIKSCDESILTVRSGATLLADSGADITSIMRFGVWKSQAVAASYIEDSKGNKRKIFKNMSNELSIYIGSTTNRPSTSKNFVQSLPQNVAPVPPHDDQNMQPPYGEFDGIYTNNGTCGELPEQVLTNDDVYDVSNDTHLDPEPKSNNINQQSNEKKRNQRVTEPVSYKRKLLTDSIINSMNMNNCKVTFKVIRNTVQDCVANNITQEDSDEDL